MVKRITKKRPTEVSTMRLTFLKLDSEVKAFGRKKCKWNKHRFKTRSKHLECGHPAQDFGGMASDTSCKLENCPRVAWGDESSRAEKTSTVGRRLARFYKKDRKEKGI